MRWAAATAWTISSALWLVSAIAQHYAGNKGLAVLNFAVCCITAYVAGRSIRTALEKGR